MNKLFSTIRIVFTLFMARMFGEYQHSGWNGEYEYARYTWQGEDWIIPTAPCKRNIHDEMGE